MQIEDPKPFSDPPLDDEIRSLLDAEQITTDDQGFLGSDYSRGLFLKLDRFETLAEHEVPASHPEVPSDCQWAGILRLPSGREFKSSSGVVQSSLYLELPTPTERNCLPFGGPTVCSRAEIGADFQIASQI